jgi:hypothetical protein
MQCVTCNMEINPKWTHAIDINICPFCGQNIMEEHLKNLLVSLKKTMDSLQSYTDQLNDWMLSNYNYIKTDSKLIINYIPTDYIDNLKKKSAINVIKENVDTTTYESVKKPLSDDRVNSFFERADLTKSKLEGFATVSEKNQYLKSLADQIKQEGAVVLDKSGDISSISPELLAQVNQSALLQYESALDGDNDDYSSLPDIDEQIPAAIVAHNTKSYSNQDALRELQLLDSKKALSQQNFKSGTKGSFRRA